MRCACVDIGTNTTRLLVAERDPERPGALREVAVERTFLALGEHGRGGGLARERVELLAATVARHAAAAHTHGAEAVRVFATAALRDLAERDAVLEELRAAAGVPVDVLTGEEEARLAFAGVTAGVPLCDGHTAVVDVGGGSTEVATGTREGDVRWWASVPLGSGGLTQTHLAGDPPTPLQLAAAREHAEDLLAAVRCPGAQAALVVGGGASTLRRVVGAELTDDALARTLRALCQAPAAEAARALGVHEARARLLPAALVVLGAVGRVVGCPLQLGHGGVREGVVLDLLARAA